MFSLRFYIGNVAVGIKIPVVSCFFVSLVLILAALFR